MAEEIKEQENATELIDQKTSTISGDSTVKTDDETGSGEGDAFDASSYEESFGLPAGTLDGVETAESALESIREYTDKTLTAGLLSNAKVDPATKAGDAPAEKVVEKVAEKLPVDTAIKGADTNPELDALRARVTEVEKKSAVREQNDIAIRDAEINRRGYEEIDKWASPKYGTSKSRNFKQAQAVAELTDLVRTHIRGYQAEGKLPPVVEKTLRQVRAHHDDEYKPSPAPKNGEAVLGSPGTGSRSAKKGDDEPANIHEALQQNSF